jgi:hypothetical protein
MSSPDFPDGTGPIAVPGETTKLTTTPDGTGPVAIPAPVPASPEPKAAPSAGTSTTPTSATQNSSPTPSPSPSPTPSATPSPNPSATPSPNPNPNPSATPSPNPSSNPSATPSPTVTSTPSPTATPTPTPTAVSPQPSASSPQPSAASTKATTSYPLNGGRQRAKALALARLSNAELERAFQRGLTPDPQGLVGWEFRGNNTPPWFRLFGIQKFVKGFYTDGDGGVWGYNSPVVQDGVERAWRLKPSDEHPKRFGFYTVEPVDAVARDNRYLHALLLDYGKGKNPRLDPTAGLRDYLVQVDRDDPDLLLGKAYYAVGPVRVPTFSFFVLDRHRPGPRELARRHG